MNRCVACNKPLEYVEGFETITSKVTGKKIVVKRYYNNHKCSNRHDAARKNRELNYREPYHVRLANGFQLMGD